MTYEPKHNDKVTVTADGFDPAVEWTVWNEIPDVSLQVLDRPSTVIIGGDPPTIAVTVPSNTLTPVAPPLPPEPPVGSVVRAHGRLWGHGYLGPWYKVGAGGMFENWHDLATAPDLSPVVAVEDVAEWLAREGCFGEALAPTFRAEFGGWDK